MMEKLVDKEHSTRELEQLKLILSAIEKIIHRNSRKKRRNRLDIYYDILRVIQNHSTSERITPTRIQLSIKTSYDKLVRYLEELEENELIKKKSLSITNKGMQFLQDYDKLNSYIKNNG